MAAMTYQDANYETIYTAAVSIMRMEMKVFCLADYVINNAASSEFRLWFQSEEDLDFSLTGLEVFLNIVMKISPTFGGHEQRESIIKTLNAYMLEDGFGFQFEGGQIIEIGSTYVHKEVVVPVLGLLSDPQYATVNQEFRKAHTEFRQGDYEDCIHDCCNAFESLMKIIAAKRGWTEITEKSTVKDLVKAIFDHQFIPAYMSTEFTGLRTILEGGVNVVRNKAGGHGQGATPRTIDKQVAEFQLNQTAAALKLLAEYDT
ncbi:MULTISPECIES: hypothetical protein [unclassified Sphingopyxis]|uniref:STM4504/CBY_0614 family protein n=1 Tax=unclassified Sphingopyxis TaxID=2614943 RepID=UPI000731A2F6|nr:MULTISPECIES: hypothetical protein [unclassified Sphingopyxis]KTE27405.1 hypothetical protein ATE61_05525 [Sphingopyxis sp. H057]KTE54708.1 hypothetical protein ATE64_05520 [Sphingopyxis sp. H073]KTE60111.1 hypothetical protein ATE66_09525 [Sphingopyxis sp. H107]KTE67603.1 hypothetical protein ATE60_19230 [Sphingopyxis sp. H081]KTE67850.1 hypothetical protein ATE65_00075 [Sphingopyxis sp. H100]